MASASQPSVVIVPHPRVVLAEVTSRTLDGPGSEAVEAEVSSASMREPGRAVVLDMSKVEFAPSVAIGALLRLASDLKFFGRRMIVVGLTRQVKGALAVTRIDRLLEVRETLAEALAAVAGK